jgi:meiotic recombination protein REC8
LNEDLSHLLSFEASFSQDNLGAGDPFSSQGGDAFGFEDTFLGEGHGLDLTLDIGEELARELGEGWGANDLFE